MCRTILEKTWSGKRQDHYRLLLDSQEIGRVWICKEKELPEICCIASVEIEECFRGKGYGKELMEHILNKAKEQKYKLVILKVKSDNEPAIKLYKHFGFRTSCSHYSEKSKVSILKMELNLE